MLKNPQGSPYKLQAGEIIEIIGINAGGAYTNPYAKVLGQQLQKSDIIGV